MTAVSAVSSAVRRRDAWNAPIRMPAEVGEEERRADQQRASARARRRARARPGAAARCSCPSRPSANRTSQSAYCDRQRAVESVGVARRGDDGLVRRRPEVEAHGIARREVQGREGRGQHQHDREQGHQQAAERHRPHRRQSRGRRANSLASGREVVLAAGPDRAGGASEVSCPVRRPSGALDVVLSVALAGCAPAAPPSSVFFASGADLQSINPLLTSHPLAKQVERFALFMTLARYDSALRAQPYLAQGWRWSADRRALDLALRSGAELQSINPLATTHPLAKQVQRFALFVTLARYDSAARSAAVPGGALDLVARSSLAGSGAARDVRWHDGAPTGAADVVFTLNAARDPATGYPRNADLACLTGRARARPVHGAPLLLPPAARVSRRAGGPGGAARPPAGGASRTRSCGARAFNEHPVGNGPYRFVSHAPNQRWVFEANRDFPAALGGPPAIRNLVIVVVDEAATKLAGLVDGELDVAGIGPMHASLVRRDPALRRCVTYPILADVRAGLEHGPRPVRRPAPQAGADAGAEPRRRWWRRTCTASARWPTARSRRRTRSPCRSSGCRSTARRRARSSTRWAGAPARTASGAGAAARWRSPS